ncbi:hypothetical protein [Arenibacter sp. ARW7G5Y1]|uniref:hypothetical protein n=1 Tax=Arenibacter sp. ARW7G5Y1 TaxID=2135619 RepID=UPI000D76B88B|nr:hypothetical protein [Arenibacter sp. ARW7G5Y1]PXX30642.1 hypothetical protein C7972_102271 [Arenibacter sp. ARW7G5Y1]
MRIKEDIPILGKVTVNFLDLSAKLYQHYIDINEIDRQKNTAHLGLISHAFKNSNHSRFDYLILQCVISELIENSFKGTTNAQGNITINGKKHFGNDVIKTWILLSNFGHCKNTIGDEKTILLHCIQNKTYKRKLLNCVKDARLKKWSEEVIDSFDYISFHHIISFIRIYKTFTRRVARQNELFNAYKLLLLPEEENEQIASSIQISQLKNLYYILRDISMISLDSRNSSLPFNLDILSTVLSLDSFEHKYQNKRISIILEPLISILCDNLYLNIKSQTHQRSYEVNASKIIGTDVIKSLNIALEKGLYNPTVCNLRHFLRIQLNKKNMVFEEISNATRQILTVKKGITGVEASMDLNPFSEERVIDFYTADNFKVKYFSTFIYNIGNIILEQIIGTAKNEFNKTKKINEIIDENLNVLPISEAQKIDFKKPIKEHIRSNIKKALLTKNLPIFKNILWAVLRYHLNEKYHFDINNHNFGKYDYFGVKVAGLNPLKENLDKAIASEKDIDRKHELNQLKKSAYRKFDGTVLICLSRIKIYNYSLAPDKRIVTDIDGVVLKFNHKELILELHEGKNTAKPVKDAIKDINAKLFKTIDKKIKGVKIKEVPNYGAKIYIRHKK